MEQTGGNFKEATGSQSLEPRQVSPDTSPGPAWPGLARPSPSCPSSPCSSGVAGTGLSFKWNRGRGSYSRKTQPKSQMLSMCLEHF